ncbi:hypothetical protein PoB_002977000 [Plakobranchus ocellatus]|uniref:Uncharacterized protein n=1 Tax=Plakobranchus ocellatus TaxID=259542 RepID=A0AAV4A543_9GAST|nr:hypothetical protein PoB_002977000 [Plakobranchus ocellatus]
MVQKRRERRNEEKEEEQEEIRKGGEHKRKKVNSGDDISGQAVVWLSKGEIRPGRYISMGPQRTVPVSLTVGGRSRFLPIYDFSYRSAHQRVTFGSYQKRAEVGHNDVTLSTISILPVPTSVCYEAGQGERPRD